MPAHGHDDQTDAVLPSLSMEERSRKVSVRVMCYERDLAGQCWLGRWKWAMSQAMQRVLETGKSKERDPPLEPPEGMQPYPHLALSPVRPVLDV